MSVEGDIHGHILELVQMDEGKGARAWTHCGGTIKPD